MKPSQELLLALQSLQTLVEDDAAWTADESAQLQALSTSTHRIEKLQPTSKYPSLIPERTEEDLNNLVAWAKQEHSIDLETIGLKAGFVSKERDDATFFAMKPIPNGSPLVTIPASAILSSALPAREEDLKKLIEHSGPAIANSPSLMLTLVLLMESQLGKSSKFSSYISALPNKLNIPFFNFDNDHKLYAALKPSKGMQAAAVRMLRAQLRDYCGVFISVMKSKLQSLPIEYLSLNNFRWGISVVMTRQNALPPKDPSPKAPPVMGLIPLWDMFNHEIGRTTTSVVISEGRLSVECTAMRDFEKDEPIKMCYGVRPSGQLALYCGFVLENGTPNDDVLITIPLVKNIKDEKIQEGVMQEKQVNMLKARVLGKKGVNVDMDKTGSFKCDIPVGQGNDAIDKALGVAGVSVMTKKEFTVYLKSADVLPSIEAVGVLERAPAATELVKNGITEALAPYREPRDPEIDWDSEPGKLIDRLLSVERKILEGGLEKLANVSPKEGETNSS